MRALPVNHNMYYAGVFFAALYSVLSIVSGIFYLQLGTRTYFLQSYPIWFIFLVMIFIVGTLILLKYYHHKKYWMAFSVGIIFLAVSLCHFIVFYTVIMTRELEELVTITYQVTLGVGVLYGISLVFSNARERYWLKVAGVFIIIFELILLTVLTWSMTVQDVQLRGSMEKILIWTSMAGALVLIPIILNFLRELKLLKENGINTTRSTALESIMALVGFAALLPTIMFASEASGAIAWHKRGSERAQVLAEPFEARIYVNSKGDTLLYRWLEPVDYDPQKKYPLVVCLHHGGGWGTDNIMQIEASEPAQLLSNPENRKKYPAFLFVPQCPPGSSFGGLPNLPMVDSLVFETISALEKEFEIDVARRYVMGTSLGGYGSWHFISTRPKMFAAAMPICGGGDPNLAQNIVDVPIWAFHGEKDRNVPVKLSRDMIESIKSAGGNPKYSEFPGAGHNIWNQVNSTPGKLDWLFAQNRD